MDVVIKETGERVTLKLIDHENGLDYVIDFIDSTNAFDDESFIWDDDIDAYVCDMDTFKWWDKVINDRAELDQRIEDLVAEYGSDRVYKVIKNTQLYCDLADEVGYIHSALDDAFGTQ